MKGVRQDLGDREIGEGDLCLCPLEGIIEIISRKWALQIIALVGNRGQMRYSEILAEIRGISPRTLAYRLRELEAAGLLKRRAFPEIPPRVEYSLTPDGLELRELIKPLMRWAALRSDQNYRCLPCQSNSRKY